MPEWTRAEQRVEQRVEDERRAERLDDVQIPKALWYSMENFFMTFSVFVCLFFFLVCRFLVPEMLDLVTFNSDGMVGYHHVN